jgi:glycosyltransferase involved in cell wall biosynthesis
MKNTKLLIYCQLFYPELISTGLTLTELCEELSLMGINIETICGPLTLTDQHIKIPKETIYQKIKIKRIWSSRFPKKNLFGKLINHITFTYSAYKHLKKDKTKRPVLVLTNPPFLAAVISYICKKQSRPLIYVVFDLYPETAIACGMLKQSSLISKVWQKINKHIYKTATHIIVLGRYMKELVSKNLDSETAKKIKHIHIWSDDRNITPVSKEKNKFTQEWQTQNKFTVIYAGNMGRFHDMETIIKAAELLKRETQIQFIFIGDGHKKQLLIDYAKNQNLENCKFFNYVSRENIGLALNAADIGLVSLVQGQEGLSVPSKTFGLMAARLPLLAIMDNKCEVARIIQEENCGTIIEPGNANLLAKNIILLAKSPNIYNNFSKNSLNAIKTKYNLKSAAKQYLELITSI